MAMARDGLLPSFFSDVNKSTQVPIKSTVVTGLFSGTLAFLMDVDQLSGMVCIPLRSPRNSLIYFPALDLRLTKFDLQVSVGTLLAFTMVSVSVLVLRYVPPDEVPLPSSFREAIDSVCLHYSSGTNGADIDDESTKTATITSDEGLPLLSRVPFGHPLLEKAAARINRKFLFVVVDISMIRTSICVKFWTCYEIRSI